MQIYTLKQDFQGLKKGLEMFIDNSFWLANLKTGDQLFSLEFAKELDLLEPEYSAKEKPWANPESEPKILN